MMLNLKKTFTVKTDNDVIKSLLLILCFQPPRSAHPVVKFTCSSQEPMVIDNLPFDKYELEPSPLTQFILARKQPTICWQVCEYILVIFVITKLLLNTWCNLCLEICNN